MRFIDSFTVKYVRKNKKDYLAKIVKNLSEYHENGLKCEIKSNQNFGRIKLELYETSKEGELILFKGLFFSNIDDFEFSEVRVFSEKLLLNNSLVSDVIVSEISDNVIKGLIYDNDVVYVVLDENKTKEMTNNEISYLVLKYLVENIFEEEFRKDDYELEIETEITDFFMWGVVMLMGFILLGLGILILFSVFFSFSYSFIFLIGFLIIGFGIYKLIRSFPKGIAAIIVGSIIVASAFGKIHFDVLEFIVILISSGLIEVGLDLIVKKKEWSYDIIIFAINKNWRWANGCCW